MYLRDSTCVPSGSSPRLVTCFLSETLIFVDVSTIFLNTKCHGEMCKIREVTKNSVEGQSFYDWKQSVDNIANYGLVSIIKGVAIYWFFGDFPNFTDFAVTLRLKKIAISSPYYFISFHFFFSIPIANTVLPLPL
jgi:hypothetical protein